MGLVHHAKRRHAVSVIWGLLGVAVTPKEVRVLLFPLNIKT